MHTITKTLTSILLGIFLAGAAPSSTTARAATPAAAQPDIKKVEQHLREHQSYPATRAQLLASCNELVDFTAAEKRWYAAHLPEGTYKSADDVLKVLRRN